MGYMADWKNIAPLLDDYEEYGGCVCEIGKDEFDRSVVGDCMDSNLPNFFILEGNDGMCYVDVRYDMPEEWSRLADWIFDEDSERGNLIARSFKLPPSDLNLENEIRRATGIADLPVEIYIEHQLVFTGSNWKWSGFATPTINEHPVKYIGKDGDRKSIIEIDYSDEDPNVAFCEGMEKLFSLCDYYFFGDDRVFIFNERTSQAYAEAIEDAPRPYGNIFLS